MKNCIWAVTRCFGKRMSAVTSTKIQITRNLWQKTAGGFPTMRFSWQ